MSGDCPNASPVRTPTMRIDRVASEREILTAIRVGEVVDPQGASTTRLARVLWAIHGERAAWDALKATLVRLEQASLVARATARGGWRVWRRAA